MKFDGNKQRYVVELDGSDESVSVKTANLEEISDGGSEGGSGNRAPKVGFKDKEDMMNELKKLRKQREEQGKKEKEVKEELKNEGTFKRWWRLSFGGSWSSLFLRLGISLVAYFFMYAGALYWVNSKIIASESTKTPATLLGRPPFMATRDDLNKLRFLNDTAALFRGLSAFKHVQPSGDYAAELHRSSLLWLAGSTYFHKSLMGGSDGAWIGTSFAEKSDVAGIHVFKDMTEGTVTRGLPFKVNRNHFSILDKSTSTTELEYSNSNSMFLGLLLDMRDEIRCLHKDLCIGFRGFGLYGGVSNGLPFVLYRRETENPPATGSKKDIQEDNDGDWEPDERREL